MRKPKQDRHLCELARIGAETQLRDLLREVKHLIDLFPHHRDSFDQDELPLSFIVAAGAWRSARFMTASRQRPGTSNAVRAVVEGRPKKHRPARRKARIA